MTATTVPAGGRQAESNVRGRSRVGRYGLRVDQEPREPGLCSGGVPCTDGRVVLDEAHAAAVELVARLRQEEHRRTAGKIALLHEQPEHSGGGLASVYVYGRAGGAGSDRSSDGSHGGLELAARGRVV